MQVKLFATLLSAFCVLTLGAGVRAADAPNGDLQSGQVSCTCEQVSCQPCEVEASVSFYTSKCGPKNSRVKSCKKPTCEPAPDQKKCLADLKNAATGGSMETGEATVPTPAVTSIVAGGGAVATNAAGTITNFAGPVNVVRANSEAGEKAKFNMDVFVGDAVETGPGGKLRIAFKDKNAMNIAPNSRVIIEAHEFDSKPGGRRKTLLNLMYGKVRNKVSRENRYDGADNAFIVKTKSAVAGVRGTDFVTTFVAGEKKWVTDVYTLEGVVEFGGSDLDQTVNVRERQSATFTIEAPPRTEITNAQLRSYIDKGELSQPRTIAPSDLKKLDAESDFKDLKTAQGEIPIDSATRVAPVSDEEAVCQHPNAQLGQCSFVCEGNKSKAIACKTSDKGVSCVRRVCNAGGRWADPTVLPKSYGADCPMGSPLVKPCGEY